MAIIGNISTINVNGNELTIKDAALTEIVNEIIDAIGANNTNIAERINNLHDRSFDALIKISSQNESEISNIQDGMYKLQYVTVTGEGDNAIETLNNSAILIQDGTNQYLYKDGQISSRIKEDNSWNDWITPEIISFDYEIIFSSGSTSSTEYNRHYSGIYKFTGDSGFGTNGIIICGSNHYAFTNTGIYHREYISGNDYTNWAPLSLGVTSFNGATGAITYTAPVTSVNGMTGAVSLSIPSKTSDLTNDSNFTTLSEVQTEIVGAAPEQLNTLAELADALNDDQNFAATITNLIGQKYTKPSTGIPASDLAVGVIPTVPVQSVNGQTGAVSLALGDTNVIETIKVNNTALTPVSKVVNITVPTKVSDLTNDSNFTSNTGTITGITMNGVSKGTSGVVNLGTVLTEHQDISGKVDKVTGMGLSSNDYTTAEKTKLAGINIGDLSNLTTAELNSIFATS